jgi:hypothetical protein
MATTFNFLKAKVLAIKHTLDSKSSHEKKDRISIQTAQQFNAVIEEIKKESPEAAPHLPQPIQSNNPSADFFSVADASFLDLEIMVNQVIGVLDVAQKCD